MCGKVLIPEVPHPHDPHFPSNQGCEHELLWWDIGFWAERLREARYDLNEEALRPYFALPNVLDGLFQVWGVDV